MCASNTNKKCGRWFTKDEFDGLKQNWCEHKRCWMNPPYGRKIGEWIKKAYEESKKGCTVVCLLPVRTDTRWFWDYIYKKENVEIRFLKGRLKFGNSKNSAPFPSMIVIFKGGI